MTNEELTILVEKLQRQLNELSDQVNKNNFSAYQEFNKTSNFTGGLITPIKNEIPRTGQYGELITVSGKLYHCNEGGTFNEK